MTDIKSFGALGDGISNDTGAFILAENSNDYEISVPSGRYIVDNISLTKKYAGAGQIILGGIPRAKSFSEVDSLPSRGNSPSDYFGGSQQYTSSEEFLVSESVDRTSLTSPYYDYPLIQHFNRSTFKSGESGYDSTIARPTVPGTNYIFVTDITPFEVGQQIVIGAYLPNREINRITAIHPTGQIDLQYEIISQIGDYTHNTIAAVGLSSRTHTSIYQTEMDVLGERVGGDFIAHNTRISCGATHNPGRNHAFDRTTIGFAAGDAYAYTDGIYIAGTEYMYFDTATPSGVPQSGDIFVIDQVKSFIREVDTGNYGSVWLGTIYKSEGSKYANSTHVISGKWKRGLDTSLADFGTEGAAISMKSGHKIYWGCSSTPDVDGFTFWGDRLGQVAMKGDNDGSDYWEVSVGGVPSLRARSSGIGIAGTITASGDILTAGNLKAIGEGSQIAVPVGGSIRLSGVGGGTYITYDGSHIYIVKNNTVVASW